MPIAKEFTDTLKSNSYKLTPQRKAVMRVLNNSKTHLTPAKVYDQVKKRYPKYSLVTIYRTLNILAELGLICEVRTGGNSKSYVAGNQEVHGHLICTECGRVMDFTDYDLDDVLKKTSEASGYDITDHRLDLYGICPECLKRKG